MARLFSLICLISSAPICSITFAQDANSQPNIILMMADDLGWADVGFNGGETIRTPELDTMASAGLVFHRFYAAAPVCSPTRGSFLTGRHPNRLGIPYANQGHLMPQELCLAELLRNKGYRTGHFGKWHLGTLTTTEKDANRGGPENAQHFSPPQNNGFDVCFSTESKVPTWDPMWTPSKRKSKDSWKAMAEPLKEGVQYGTYYWNEKGEKVSDNLRGDNSRIIVDRVEPFVRKSAESKQPFFAVVWFHTPHLPVVAGPEYAAMYPDAKSEKHRNYYGCVTAMDEQVGRIRNVLRELNIEQNTLLTFCSDNGPEGKSSSPGSALPFRGRKRGLLEGGVRVPCIMEWPARIGAGSTTKIAAVTSDFLPTVADIVDAEMTVRPIDGMSLLPVFDGEINQRTKPIGFESRGKSAWHVGQFKIYREGKAKPWNLFDLENDPTESNDLASKMPDRVQAMSADFEKWAQSCLLSAAQ